MLSEKHPQHNYSRLNEKYPQHNHKLTVKKEGVNMKEHLKFFNTSLADAATGVMITAEVEAVNSEGEKTNELPLNTVMLLILNDRLNNYIKELKNNGCSFITDKDIEAMEELHHFIEYYEKPQLYPQHRSELLVVNYTYKDEYPVFDRTYLNEFSLLLRRIEIAMEAEKEGVLNV